MGMQKGKGHEDVTAVKVFDFLPMVKQLNNKTVVVVCDDVIEDELLKTSGKSYVENNDFMLHSFTAHDNELDSKLQLDIHRAALYKNNDTLKVPEDILKNTLGKKRLSDSSKELERSVCLEHVRDYVLTRQEPTE